MRVGGAGKKYPLSEEEAGTYPVDCRRSRNVRRRYKPCEKGPDGMPRQREREREREREIEANIQGVREHSLFFVISFVFPNLKTGAE